MPNVFEICDKENLMKVCIQSDADLPAIYRENIYHLNLIVNLIMKLHNRKRKQNISYERK